MGYYFSFKMTGLLSIFVVAISLIVFIKLKNWWDFFLVCLVKSSYFFCHVIVSFLFLSKNRSKIIKFIALKVKWIAGHSATWCLLLKLLVRNFMACPWVRLCLSGHSFYESLLLWEYPRLGHIAEFLSHRPQLVKITCTYQ